MVFLRPTSSSTNGLPPVATVIMRSLSTRAKQLWMARSTRRRRTAPLSLLLHDTIFLRGKHGLFHFQSGPGNRTHRGLDKGCACIAGAQGRAAGEFTPVSRKWRVDALVFDQRCSEIGPCQRSRTYDVGEVGKRAGDRPLRRTSLGGGRGRSRPPGPGADDPSDGYRDIAPLRGLCSMRGASTDSAAW